MIREEIIKWIEEIEEYKKRKGINPFRATHINLMSRGKKEGYNANIVKDTLNQMWLDKVLLLGETINSKYVLIIKDKLK